MASPADYANQYRNLSVGFDDGPVKVTIERYHLGDPDSEKEPLSGGVKDYILAQQKKDSSFTLDLIVNGAPVSMKTFTEVALHIADPFFGKGSPEDCQIAAQLAVLMKRTTKDKLPRWCQDHLGLDCTGFAGNFIYHVRNGNPWQSRANSEKEVGPSSAMEKFVAIGHPVTDVSKINPANHHIFVELDASLTVISGGASGAGHIAISEPNKYTPTSFVINSMGGLDVGFAKKGAYGHPALWAVESTGPQGAIGLKESWYAIKKPLGTKKQANRGLYEVFRGSKASNLNFELVALPPV